MNFKIEKGIKLNGRYNTITGFLRSMKTGESFVCALKKRSSMLVLARQAGLRIATRKTSAAKVRVWRTA